MREVNIETISRIFFLAMVWSYFSLNTTTLNIPYDTLLRWILPAVLVFCALSIRDLWISRPPLFISLYTIAVIPSCIVGLDSSISFNKLIAFLLVIYGSYIFFSAINDELILEDYFYIFSIVVVIFQVFNFIYTLIGLGYDSGRAMGITTNANTLGVYSNVAFWCAFYLLMRFQNIYIKFIYGILIFSAIYTALLSGSRSAFVIIVANIVILVLLISKNILLKILISVILIVILYIFLQGGFSNLNIIALNRFEELGTNRDDIWGVGLSIWENYKVFGCGYTLSKLVNPIVGLQFHNSYLSYLIECGVWGIVFGLGVLANVLWHAWQVVKYHISNNVSVVTIVALIMLNLGLTAWGESFLFAIGSTEGFTFWLLASWLIAYSNSGEMEV